MEQLSLFSELSLHPESSVELGEAERQVWASETSLGRLSDRPLLIGVDEAGRGPWAGPVVAAAVILPEGLGVHQALPASLRKLNDSKKLTEHHRSELIKPICQIALAVGVGIRSASRIDEVNIAQANFEAMREALDQALRALDRRMMNERAHVRLAMIDGKFPIPNYPLPQSPLIKGDQRSLHIAAASIIAKVTRDKIMIAADRRFPSYGFAQHKGYGTRAHQHALSTFGPTPLHRKSYRPVREVIERSP